MSEALRRAARQHRVVTCLPGRQRYGDRTAHVCVDLGDQPTAGAPNDMVIGLVGEFPVIRKAPLCRDRGEHRRHAGGRAHWSSQPITARPEQHVPHPGWPRSRQKDLRVGAIGRPHRRCRSSTDWHAPNCSGRSRHGDPVRYRQIMPSNVRRWSFHGRPRRRLEGIDGSISDHKSSETTSVRTIQQASGTTPFTLSRHAVGGWRHGAWSGQPDLGTCIVRLSG